MTSQSEPLAFNLYRRYRGGQSCEQLASELAIPIDRIRLRIRAAAAWWARSTQADPAAESRASLVSLCEKVGEAA